MEKLVELRDGTRLWTTVSGAGLPAILLNGGPGMADYLGPVAGLVDPHLRVHRYEQRGCGRSDAAGDYKLNTFVSDIEELRNYWGISQWFVVGHSWGVDLGLAYVLQYPASALGLVGLSGGRIHNDRNWKKAYDHNKHREAPPPAAAAPNLEVNKALNGQWKEYCRAPELLHRLASLDVPTLFLYGENDVRPSWPTEQIGHLIPNSKFHRIARADHHLWQDNPDDLRNLILGFLSDQAIQL